MSMSPHASNDKNDISPAELVHRSVVTLKIKDETTMTANEILDADRDHDIFGVMTNGEILKDITLTSHINRLWVL